MTKVTSERVSDSLLGDQAHPHALLFFSMMQLTWENEKWPPVCQPLGPFGLCRVLLCRGSGISKFCSQHRLSCLLDNVQEEGINPRLQI